MLRLVLLNIGLRSGRYHPDSLRTRFIGTRIGISMGWHNRYHLDSLRELEVASLVFEHSPSAMFRSIDRIEYRDHTLKRLEKLKCSSS